MLLLIYLKGKLYNRGDGLDITYKSKKIEKICTDAKVADKTYGKEMSEKIHMRIDEIMAVDSIEEMIKYRIGRCHPLINNRKGQYAVDLVQPYRLVFEKHGDEIQIAHIMEIVDYH
jgi:proteic killer suppression protein